jgi:hypothetical protein
MPTTLIIANSEDRTTITLIKPVTFGAALDAFCHVAVMLSAAWEQTDHTGDFYADKYPFAKSFDEVVDAIIEWRDATQGS